MLMAWKTEGPMINIANILDNLVLNVNYKTRYYCE